MIVKWKSFGAKELKKSENKIFKKKKEFKNGGDEDNLLYIYLIEWKSMEKRTIIHRRI